LPALRKLFRDQFPVLLRAVNPFLRNLNPILAGLELYDRDIAGTLGNVAAASNAVHLSSAGQQIHYLRVLGPFGPESLASYPARLGTNRNSAYSQPGSASRLAKGLLNFHTSQCSVGVGATLDPDTPTEEDFNERTGGDVTKATAFFERLKLYAYAGQQSTALIPAPGCSPQAPFEPIYGRGPKTLYQHTFEQPEP